MATPTKPVIEIREQVYNTATKAAGLLTDKAKADAFGVSRAYVNRIQNRHTTPSSEFMAAVSVALRLSLDELFKVNKDAA